MKKNKTCSVLSRDIYLLVTFQIISNLNNIIEHIQWQMELGHNIYESDINVQGMGVKLSSSQL